jgi:hypothetical protein
VIALSEILRVATREGAPRGCEEHSRMRFGGIVKSSLELIYPARFFFDDSFPFGAETAAAFFLPAPK